jgi:hypothetical protein
MSPEVKAGSGSAKRLGLIHEAAIKMAKGLEPYQCGVLEAIRRVGNRRAVSLRLSALSDAGRWFAIGDAPGIC